MTGRKDDAGKVDYTLLPVGALSAVCRVLAHGADKYGRENWRKVEPARYVRAALRHTFAFVAGERQDAETGESPLAHAAASLLLAIEIGGGR